MQRKLLTLVVLIAGGIPFLPMPAMAQNSGAPLSKQALEECNKGRLATDRPTRLAHFRQGQTLGERAVAAEEGSADAHFALFCNLGELLRVDGETLTSIFGLRRMMNELDRALEINPAHVDALSAKGTLLVKLPSFLGGDSEKGEQLLQHVVKQAPRSVNARLALARVWCQQGRHDDAVALASEALAIAEKHQRLDFIPEAQAVLQQAKTNAAKTKEHRS
jgi:tetratricopeptide (TPR) repeat protein